MGDLGKPDKAGPVVTPISVLTIMIHDDRLVQQAHAIRALKDSLDACWIMLRGNQKRAGICGEEQTQNGDLKDHPGQHGLGSWV